MLYSRRSSFLIISKNEFFLLHSPKKKREYIILALFFLLPIVGTQVGVTLDPFGMLIGGPLQWLLHAVAWLTGHSVEGY